MKKTLMALAIVAMCGSAFADNENKDNGTLPGCNPSGGTPQKCDTSTGGAGGNGGNGGNGGSGGAGGAAYGYGGAASVGNVTGGNATGGNATGGSVIGGNGAGGIGGSASGGTANTVSGPATTVGGVANTNGGTANTTGGTATTNSGAINSSSTNNIGNASGIGTKTFSPEANANSTNLNTNANTNKQGQAQGQQQGQTSSNTNSTASNVSNSGNSSSTSKGGNVKNSGNSTNANNSSASTGPVTVTITNPDTSDALRVTADSNRARADATVQAALLNGASAKEVAEIQAQALRDAANSKIRNTPSVDGPALTSSNDTCMGSTSGSVNAPGIGVGFGTSWVDANCKMLKNSRELWNMGFKAASVALMCNDPDNRAALESTGFECPGTPKKKAGEKQAAVEYTDPIVRARLGLPALK